MSEIIVKGLEKIQNERSPRLDLEMRFEEILNEKGDPHEVDFSNISDKELDFIKEYLDFYDHKVNFDLADAHNLEKRVRDLNISQGERSELLACLINRIMSDLIVSLRFPEEYKKAA